MVLVSKEGDPVTTPITAADVFGPRGVPITEDWLRSCGWKWEQLECQPSKHWILWIATACIDHLEKSRRLFASNDDLGIELSKTGQGDWFCWLRADYAGRYSRLLHVRHLMYREEVVQIIEALTGRPFIIDDCMYGSFHPPETAARLRDDNERLDQRIAREWGKRVEQETGADPDQRRLLKP